MDALGLAVKIFDAFCASLFRKAPFCTLQLQFLYYRNCFCSHLLKAMEMAFIFMGQQSDAVEISFFLRMIIWIDIVQNLPLS